MGMVASVLLGVSVFSGTVWGEARRATAKSTSLIVPLTLALHSFGGSAALPADLPRSGILPYTGSVTCGNRQYYSIY